MKSKIKISIYLLTLLSWGAAACSDDMEMAEVKVTPQASEFVKVANDTIYVVKGKDLTFNFNGNPNIITFYSGELGKEYRFKDRTMLTAINPSLSAEVKRENGIPAATTATMNSDDFQKFGLRLYWSPDMPDYTGDYETDRAAIAKATWNELVDEVKIGTIQPLHFDPMTRVASFYKRGPYSVLPATGKFKIAILAKGNPQAKSGTGNTSSQNYTIRNFILTAKDSETGSDYNLTPTNLNFRPLMTLSHIYKDFYNEKIGAFQTGLSAEYKTFNPYWFYQGTENTTYPWKAAMPNTAYLWQMANATTAANPNFAITAGATTSSPEGASGIFDDSNPLWKTHGYESWLISKTIDFTNLNCTPDVGVALKNASVSMAKYSYSYAKSGKYKASFLPGNVDTYNAVTGQVSEFNVKVVDVLP